MKEKLSFIFAKKMTLVIASTVLIFGLVLLGQVFKMNQNVEEQKTEEVVDVVESEIEEQDDIITALSHTEDQDVVEKLTFFEDPITEHSSVIGSSNGNNQEYILNDVLPDKNEENKPVIPEVGPQTIPIYITLFTEDNVPLSDAKVSILSQQEMEMNTSSKGFLEINALPDKEFTVEHPLVSAKIHVSQAGEMTISSERGEVVSGWIERTGAGYVQYHEKIIEWEAHEADKIVSLDYEGGKIAYQGHLNLTQNEVVIIPPFQNELGLAIKVVSTHYEDDKTIILFEQPDLSEVYKKLDFEVEPLLNEAFFKAEEGVEINDIATYDLKSIGLKLNFKLDGYEVIGQLVLDVDANAKVDIDFPFLELPQVNELEFDIMVNPKTSVILKNTSLTYNNKKFVKQLGEFSIPTTVQGVSVDIPVKINFTARSLVTTNMSANALMQIGVQYNHHSLNVYPEDEDRFALGGDIDFRKLTGDARLGVQASVDLAALRLKVVGLGVESGLKVLATPQNLCTKYKTSVYGELGFVSPILPILEKLKLTADWLLREDSIGNCNGNNFTVLPQKISMIPGEELYLRVMDNGEDVTLSDSVHYKSENNNKLTVDSKGKLTAKSFGAGETTNVTVSYKKGDVTSEKVVPVYINKVESKGTLKGQIIDAVTEEPISQVDVTIYTKTGEYVNRYSTTLQGNYSAYLAPGEYHVVLSKYGYLKESGTIIIKNGNTTTYEPKLKLIGEDYQGEGTIVGKVTNSLTKEGISDVKLEIYKGFNQTEGELISTVHTSETGEYNLTLPSGNYTAILQKDGFSSTSLTMTSIGTLMTVQPTISLSPEGIELSDLRIVLNWGNTPRDLDSHFIGTKESDLSDYFHIYFSNRSFYDINQKSWLDVDERNGFGPETITLTGLNSDGHYVYAVHDYTNKNSNDENPSDALANSKATVYVYSNNELVARFNVPTDEEGNVWKVFEVIDGIITPLNEVEYISNYSSYSPFFPSRLQRNYYLTPHLLQENVIKSEGEIGLNESLEITKTKVSTELSEEQLAGIEDTISNHDGTDTNEYETTTPDTLNADPIDEMINNEILSTEIEPQE